MGIFKEIECKATNKLVRKAIRSKQRKEPTDRQKFAEGLITLEERGWREERAGWYSFSGEEPMPKTQAMIEQLRSDLLEAESIIAKQKVSTARAYAIARKT